MEPEESAMDASVPCASNWRCSGVANVGQREKQLEIFECFQSIDERINQSSLDNVLAPGQFIGGLTRPRTMKVTAAFNRRSLRNNENQVEINERSSGFK